MDSFFHLLKKSLVATVFIIFAFVATYIPQPYNQVHEVEAVGGGALEVTQLLNNVQLYAVNLATTATQWATNNLWVKEYLLDGIAWTLAKTMISSMVSSLVNWINSGFEGSPMFVQDLQNFLLQTADEVMGEYIEDLGAIGSFICSPFRLDVQVSVALQYDRDRGDGQPAPTCTLSGVIDNIEGFIGGSFNEGGWKDWFTISATPQTYTPYGSALAAQAGARARVINAQGEEIKLLEFGDGFLSGEICNTVHGPNTTREDCFISKPGKIIEEALSFNLDSGRQSLITADEIDEVISALLGQLANTALTGAAGLLGLSGGTGSSYTKYSYEGSFADQVVSSSFDYSQSRQLIADALAIQTNYRNVAIDYESRLNTYATDPANAGSAQIDAVRAARDTARSIIIDTTGAFPPPFTPTQDSLIGRLNTILAQYDNPSTTDLERLNVIQDYTALNLYTEANVTTSASNWELLLQ
jgi:hypothetical protein